MGRKDTLNGWNMLTKSGGDMSASFVSDQTSIQYQDNVGILVSWSGSSPVGALTVEVSNDSGFATFNTLDFGSAIAVSGNTGSHILNMSQLPFGFLRMRYTRTSGTGTLTASLNSKQVGG